MEPSSINNYSAFAQYYISIIEDLKNNNCHNRQKIADIVAELFTEIAELERSEVSNAKLVFTGPDGDLPAKIQVDESVNTRAVRWLMHKVEGYFYDNSTISSENIQNLEVVRGLLQAFKNHPIENIESLINAIELAQPSLNRLKNLYTEAGKVDNAAIVDSLITECRKSVNTITSRHHFKYELNPEKMEYPLEPVLSYYLTKARTQEDLLWQSMVNDTRHTAFLESSDDQSQIPYLEEFIKNDLFFQWFEAGTEENKKAALDALALDIVNIYVANDNLVLGEEEKTYFEVYEELKNKRAEIERLEKQLESPKRIRGSNLNQNREAEMEQRKNDLIQLREEIEDNEKRFLDIQNRVAELVFDTVLDVIQKFDSTNYVQLEDALIANREFLMSTVPTFMNHFTSSMSRVDLDTLFQVDSTSYTNLLSNAYQAAVVIGHAAAGAGVLSNQSKSLFNAISGNTAESIISGMMGNLSASLGVDLNDEAGVKLFNALSSSDPNAFIATLAAAYGRNLDDEQIQTALGLYNQGIGLICKFSLGLFGSNDEVGLEDLDLSPHIEE